MKIKWTLLFFIAAIIMAANLYLLYHQSIRLDESQSINLATRPLGTLIKYNAGDVHVPLYFLLLHFWIQIFGTNVFAIRTLSLIFFIFSLPFIYIVAKASSNKNIAFLTIILIMLSPFIMWFTMEARMYTLLILVTIINHFLFLRTYNTDGERGKTEYVLSAIAGLYTHYFFIFLLASQAIYVLYERLYIKKSSFTKTYFALLFTSFLFFVPWIIYVLIQGKITNTQPLLAKPTTYNIFQTLINFVFGFQKYNIQTVLISMWPLLIVLFFAVFTQKRKIHIRNIEYFLITTFVPVILVFVISYFRPIFLPRYLIFVTPTMFLILAWLILNASKSLTSLVPMALLAVMILFLVYQNSSSATPVKEDYQDVVAYLNTTVHPQDLVAVSAPFTVYPIEYYYNGAARITTIPAWDRFNEEGEGIPAYDPTKITQQLKSYEGEYDRLVVVLSYDQGYEQDLIQYLDSHYHRLDKKNFPPTIEVRIYKMRY